MCPATIPSGVISTAWYRLIKIIALALLLASSSLTASCGGGSGTSSGGNGGGGGGGGSPEPNFGIGDSPDAVTVSPGGAATVQLMITALSGFTGSVSVTVTGAPSGVTFSPPLPLTMAAGGQGLSLFVPANVSTGSYLMMVQASAGTIQHNVPLQLIVQQQSFANFSINLNNSELSMVQGGSASTIVGSSITTNSGNTNFGLEFSVSGLPNGVQAAFGSNPLVVGGSTSLALTASTNATLANYVTVTVTGTRTADGAAQTATFLLNVTPPIGTLANNRANFVRTDGTPAAAVYDPGHNVVYSANTAFNRVDVISPEIATITTSIPVPTPASLARTPDGTQLIVGSNVNQILNIDTTSLQVVQRTSVVPLADGNNPTLYYFSVQRIAPASNGKLLLGMINSPTDPQSFYVVEWNPVAGTYTPMNPPGIGFSLIRDMAGSANGAKVLLVDYGTALNLAVYDAASDSFTASGQSPVGQELAIAAHPSGTQFAILGGNGLAIVDNQLNVVAEPSIGGGAVYGMQYSPDGSKLLISYLLDLTYPIIEVFDTTSFSLLGVAPAFSECVGIPCQYVMAQSLAADGTGLVFSSFGHGLVFEDGSNFQNLLGLPTSELAPTVGIGPQNEASLNTAFATTLGQSFFDVPPDVWFGETRGTDSSTGSGLISVTAPPSTTPGIANVKAVLPDGWMALAPQVFSYGTEILFKGTTAAPASGNVPLYLVGHGFIGANGSATTVTIGGKPAQILTPPHQDFAPSSDQFPIAAYDEIEVQVPPGAAGPADITITSSVGSATLSSAFTYLPGVTDYASTDKFTNILYDKTRNRVYLAAGNRIDVFDAAANNYLSPITPPSVSASPVFQGLALTPDASKLLLTNLSDTSLDIIDPDNPPTATEVPLSPGATAPATGGDVAATSTNQAIVELSGAGTCSSFAEVLDVDLGTVAVTSFPTLGCLRPNHEQMSSTAAGDKVLLAFDAAGTYLWNAATNQWISWQYIVSDNATSSGDGYWFGSDYTSLDSQLVEHTQAQIPEYFASYFDEGPQGAVFGEKMNASGSLLYQPLLQGVDVIDTSTGAWLRRIALTEQVQLVQNAMALDETGNRLFLITNAGLTVLQMDPPPLSIGYLSPATGPAAGGTTVTIRGSGFQPTATVTFGGVAASTTYVDASTLQVTTPALPAGGVRVTVSNSASSSYSLDAAFQAN
jgi:hypothetical protein